MKKAIVILSLIMAMTAYAEKLSVSTPTGKFSVELEGIIKEKSDDGRKHEEKVEVKQEKNKNDEDLLIYNLIKKIKKLDANYIADIENEKEREDARVLLKDMYVLLEALHPDKSMLFKIANDVEYKPEKKEKPVVKENTVTDENYSTILSRVKSEPFNAGKMSIVKIVLKDKKINLNQCKMMLDEFDFDDGKLMALEYLYPKVLDKDNGFTLIDLFTFPSSQERVKNIIGN